MTTYVPSPRTVSLTVNVPTLILTNTDDDLTGNLMEITYYCDDETVFDLQYDLDGTGSMWVAQDQQTLTDESKTFKYIGKGKTRVWGTNSSSTATTNGSVQINTTVFTGYCTIDEVREATGLTADDASDSAICSLVQLATAQLNKDVNKIRIEEEVDAIDTYRQNDIDGSNAVYYVQNGYTWYLADLDNDGTVGTSDVHAYGYSNQTRTELTVSSVDASRGMGKVTLSSAPSGLDKMTITYAMSPVHYQDLLLKQACIQLCTALTYTGIEAKDFSRISLGRLSIMKQPSIGFMTYMQQYKTTVHQINSRIMGKVEGPELSRDLEPISRKTIAGESGR